MVTNDLILTMTVIAGVFWLVQLIDAMCRDQAYFESHTHKLVWFLVLILGNIVGAIWYYRWKREACRAYDRNSRNVASQMAWHVPVEQKHCITTECPHCSGNVIPTADDLCPACRKHIQSKESEQIDGEGLGMAGAKPSPSS